MKNIYRLGAPPIEPTCSLENISYEKHLQIIGAHLSIGNNVPSMKIFAGGDIGGILGRKTMLTRHSL